MTHSLAHPERLFALDALYALDVLTADVRKAFSASHAFGSVCVSVHRTDDVFAKASWPKSTVKTIFVTRGEGIPSDD